MTVKQLNDQMNDPNLMTKDGLRRSSRIEKEPDRFTFDKQHGYLVVECYLRKTSHSIMTLKGHEYCMQYVLNLLIDPDYGIFDNVPMNDFACYPHIKKAAAKNEPDTPNLKKALSGP